MAIARSVESLLKRTKWEKRGSIINVLRKEVRRELNVFTQHCHDQPRASFSTLFRNCALIRILPPRRIRIEKYIVGETFFNNQGDI